MRSLKEFYCIGHGPSSSHTMGPQKAARIFQERFPEASAYRVTLYGALAATGKGHLTDTTIINTFAPTPTTVIFKPEITKSFHTNGLYFEALNVLSTPIGSWEVYSVGGSALKEPTENSSQISHIYPLKTFTEIVQWCLKEDKALWEYVKTFEDESTWEYLSVVWKTMQQAINEGLQQTGILPGSLKYPRKAEQFYHKALKEPAFVHGRLFAYALAVSEQNASGGIVVTAPTCGASGVVPAVLRYLKEKQGFDDKTCIKALAVAGIIGNIVKHNGSISGAEVGCQGEVGVACSMAAGMAAFLFGGNIHHIEYAAEMGLEHHLGMTCDPVGGYVQVPCIERNAVAAGRAISAAEYTSYTDGKHRVSFDQIIQTMVETGRDMHANYKETSQGGLAKRNI